MEKLNLSYLTVNSAKSYSFFLVPDELTENPAFDDIDYGAKMLYGKMLSRASLSAKNSDFIDKNGNVYIIYTIEQVMEKMRCSTPTAVKMLKQLDDKGLIEKKRRGQGKPSIIYVKDFSTVDSSELKDVKFKNLNKLNSKIEKDLKSRTKNVLVQEFKDVKSNHINQSHINQSHINSNYIDSINSEYPVDNSNIVTLDDVRLVDKEKKEDLLNNDNTSYNHNPIHNLNIGNLIPKHPDKKETLWEIDNLISEVFNGREQTFRIGRQNIETYKVRSALNKIDNRHIEFVLVSLKKDKKDIKSYKNYLLTALYNSTKQNFIDVDFVKNVVRKNINLDGLLNCYNDKRKDIEELYGIIIETLCTQKKSFRIARGELPSELVKQSFADISEEHIHYVMESLSKNTSEITSAKAFLQTCLWNSTKTINNHLSLDARRFLYEHLGIEPK